MNSVYIAKSTSNLSNISFKYYKFTNIFSKFKAEVLILYWPYDLKINLEDAFAATNTNDSKGVKIYIELVYSCYKLKPKS